MKLNKYWKEMKSGSRFMIHQPLSGNIIKAISNNLENHINVNSSPKRETIEDEHNIYATSEKEIT